MPAQNSQLKLYKIDTSLLPDSELPVMITEIIERANKKHRGNSRYLEQRLNSQLRIPAGFDIKIYHAARLGLPGWAEAWTDMIHESSQMLTTQNKMSSFIAFISYGENLYALTGGQGNFEINRYTASFFGLDVIDHLIESNTDRGINEASKNAVAGNIKTELRTFFGLTDAWSQDSFETFFKMLKSKLNREVVEEYFGEFYPKRDYSSFFQGSDYFLIRKAIPVVKVFELIKLIERVFTERTSSGHNKLIPIGSVKSKTSTLVEKLNTALIQYLLQNQNNPDSLDAFYFAPKIPIAIIDSCEFAIESRAQRIIREHLLPEIPKVSEYVAFLLNVSGRRREFRDYRDLEEAFGTYKIFWKPQEDDSFNSFDPLDSLNGVLEVRTHDKSYLRFEDRWYEMRQNFVEVVDQEFLRLLDPQQPRVISDPTFLTPWIGSDENAYNYSYLENDEIMVTHKVMKRDRTSSLMEANIEYADLLHLNSTEPKFIHVKRLCNGDMRVAAAQVTMCAQKLLQSENKEGFLREYYIEL